uniref:Uncharacterized protein n=1 Tax=Arundo donax TaxID=35708 RepID=A0A0A8YDW5_ARUDO
MNLLQNCSLLSLSLSLSLKKELCY